MGSDRVPIAARRIAADAASCGKCVGVGSGVGGGLEDVVGHGEQGADTDGDAVGQDTLAYPRR